MPDKINITKSKKNRGLLFAGILLILFVSLSLFEINIFTTSQKLPITHAIFFFGLVNFNVIVILLILFLIFRSVAKAFSEKRVRFFGKTLKAKLLIAFLGFALIPTTLMFVVSVLHINSSFDKWFSQKIPNVLKSSIEVSTEYDILEKKRGFAAAYKILEDFDQNLQTAEIEKYFLKHIIDYYLDQVEYYKEGIAEKIVVRSDYNVLPDIPEPEEEFLKKGIEEDEDSSSIKRFSEGKLIRVIVPVPRAQGGGAIVVSRVIPLSVTAHIDDITKTYQEFSDIDLLEIPLKSIYLIILLLMTLVILFGGVWFSIYLAGQLSNSLEALGEATRKVSKGDYQTVPLKASTLEVHQLVSNFNRMLRDLEGSHIREKEIKEDLKTTLSQLDERNTFVKTVISNVNTGVISLSKNEVITMINQKAINILGLSEVNLSDDDKIGVILTGKIHDLYEELVEEINRPNITKAQRVLKIDEDKNLTSYQITLSHLKDDADRVIGKILVFNDLSVVARAERAAAWKEVARRVAHEIKNPLTPIKLSAERLQRKFGAEVQNQAFDDSIKMIVNQTDELKKLVNEFSDFARMPQIMPTKNSINKAILECINLFGVQLSENKKVLSFFQGTDIPEFYFDEGQIKRAVVNLITNAMSAVSNLDEPKIEISSNLNELDEVIIKILDNGPGIPESQFKRIFDPYYSTKVKGSGLGLAIVRQIVEDHNGHVECQRAHPSGLAFTIRLPVIVNVYKHRSTLKGQKV